jgi:hypothetical protein
LAAAESSAAKLRSTLVDAAGRKRNANLSGIIRACPRSASTIVTAVFERIISFSSRTIRKSRPPRSRGEPRFSNLINSDQIDDVEKFTRSLYEIKAGPAPGGSFAPTPQNSLAGCKILRLIAVEGATAIRLRGRRFLAS